MTHKHKVRRSRLSPLLRIALVCVLALSLYTAWRDLAGGARRDDRAAAGDISASRAGKPLSAKSAAHAVDARATASQVNLFPRQGRIDPPSMEKTAPVTASLATSSAAPTAKAPRPPPLPLRVVGLWRDAGGRNVVLSLDATHYVVCAACPPGTPGRYRPGDVLPPPATDYRVLAVTQHRIAFEYLPLSVRQCLSLDAFAIPSDNR